MESSRVRRSGFTERRFGPVGERAGTYSRAPSRSHLPGRVQRGLAGLVPSIHL